MFLLINITLRVEDEVEYIVKFILNPKNNVVGQKYLRKSEYDLALEQKSQFH